MWWGDYSTYDWDQRKAENLQFSSERRLPINVEVKLYTYDKKNEFILLNDIKTNHKYATIWVGVNRTSEVV